VDIDVPLIEHVTLFPVVGMGSVVGTGIVGLDGVVKRGDDGLSVAMVGAGLIGVGPRPPVPS
jgi:hypothetical protein